MKIINFDVRKKEQGKTELAIQVEAESQKEAALLVYVINRFPSAIKAFGKVGEFSTWAWIKIQLKNVPFGTDYFGNDKS